MHNTEHLILQLQVLLAFTKGSPDTHTVVNIGKSLDLTKQKVSRLLKELEEGGYVDRSDCRQPKLTEAGEQMAAYYADRLSLAFHFLLYDGVSLAHAQHDAYIWALYNSEETMDALRKTGVWHRLKEDLRSRKDLNGAVVCAGLEDGLYRFPFMIYRQHATEQTCVSMANEGFEHPGNLIVKNGMGRIHLRIRTMTARTRTGEEAEGKVVGVKYYADGIYQPAAVSEDLVSFPAAALHFIGGGTDERQVLHGSVSLQMSCSVGETLMPEAKAVFTVMV